MATDPNIKRQLAGAVDMKKSLERTNDTLRQQIRLFERQEGEARRMPNSDRERARIKDQIREANRSIDRNKTNIKSLERQIGDLKRMAAGR